MITIEQARVMLNDVRTKESKARSDFNKYKTEEYNNIFKKVKAERRKVVKLCKAVGMNVSPSGVEQPEGAPIWIKKKYRTEAYNAAVRATPKVVEKEETVDAESMEPEELKKYSKFLEYLKSNNVISEEIEKKACDFIKDELKRDEQELNRHEETLRKLVEIGSMSKNEYDSYMEALRNNIYNL